MFQSSYQVEGNPKTVKYWLAEILGKAKPHVTLSEKHSVHTWMTCQNMGMLKFLHDNTKEMLRSANEFLQKNDFKNE